MSIAAPFRHLIVVIAPFATMPACRDEAPEAPDEAEYIQNPNPESIEPFCKWQEEPTPPEGMEIHRIAAGIPVEDEGQSCDAFPPADIDQLLIEEYKNSVVADCDPEPFELLRGCYDRPFNGERCIFSAYVISPCPLSLTE